MFYVGGGVWTFFMGVQVWVGLGGGFFGVGGHFGWLGMIGVSGGGHSFQNNPILFKYKQQLTGQTGNGGTKKVEIMVPLNDLSKFWRTHEMSLINSAINIWLKWS